MVKYISSIVFIFSIYFLTLGVADRLDYISISRDKFQAPPLSEYSPMFRAIATLGQTQLYEDFISIWLTNELQNPHTPDEVPELDKFVMSILRLKPKVPSAYYLSCIELGFKLKAYDKCNKYLEIGKKIFPKDWKYPFTQGYISLFIQSQPNKAVEYFDEATKIEGVPEYVESIKNKLQSRINLSIEWTDRKSDNYKEMELFLKTDPFLDRLLKIQETLETKSW